MSEPLAIALRDVTKTYRLFGSQRQQLLEVLGLNRFRWGRPAIPSKEFTALSGVTLDIKKGQRIGIVGRNGAGKTTLLKLICGNFAPSSGQVEVNGAVQALMGMGIGFHPDYTGRENALASLQYNGLSREEYEQALADIVDFCELGEFIDQPFKTYSLGMQARLMFATSTAIRPDILIVDEVLGAGDAYFVAKSRVRMENLVRGGCTMLLVSHSTQQVLEMCTEAVWLDQGKIRMQGDAFVVVKAYEEYVHGANKVFSLSEPGGSPKQPPDSAQIKRSVEAKFLQEPSFVPHLIENPLKTDACSDPAVFNFQARGGLSRWESDIGLKVTGFDIQSSSGSTNRLVSLLPAKFVFFLTAEEAGDYSCRYGLAVHDMHGKCMLRIFSPEDRFSTGKGEVRTVEVLLNPVQLGPGEYSVGISVLEYSPLELINTARRYDLLGRSFEFRVDLPDSLVATECALYHSAEWTLR